MTRISTAGQSQLMLDSLLRNQEKLQKSQFQISTLKVSDDFKGIARDALTILGARKAEAETRQFSDSNVVLGQRLQTYDLALQRLSEISLALRDTLLGAVNAGNAPALMSRIESSFRDAVSVLNTKVDGQYIFAGSRTDTPPVNATTSAALLALPAIADGFDNNTIKAQSRVAENSILEYGVVADGVGTDLLDAFRRIMQFNAGTLPSGATGPASAYQDPLTQVQRDFLQGEVVSIGTVFRNLNQEVAKNGVNMRLVDRSQKRHEDDLLLTRKIIGELEDVNPAEAVTRLNDNRTALEASMQILARINELSLLNFL